MGFYKCPQCTKQLVVEDARAKSYYCQNGCQFSVEFDEVRRVASASIGKPFDLEDNRAPSSRYRLSEGAVEGILLVLYETHNAPKRTD